MREVERRERRERERECVCVCVCVRERRQRAHQNQLYHAALLVQSKISTALLGRFALFRLEFWSLVATRCARIPPTHVDGELFFLFHG
jgi:hypothetical protein